MYAYIYINTYIKKTYALEFFRIYIHTQLHAYISDIIYVYGYIYTCVLKQATHSMMRQLYFEAHALDRELLPISK